MVTTEGLRQLLREANYRPVKEDGPAAYYFWTSPAGVMVSFAEACREGLNRCTCCGELDPGKPRAACFARHEAKDCNCYTRKVVVGDEIMSVAHERPLKGQ